MVFTHLPSNILLILVPLMPNLPLAIAVLFVRFSISQMDVPTRQSFVMAVVPPDDRRRPRDGRCPNHRRRVSRCWRSPDRQSLDDRLVVLPGWRSEKGLRPFFYTAVSSRFVRPKRPESREIGRPLAQIANTLRFEISAF